MAKRRKVLKIDCEGSGTAVLEELRDFQGELKQISRDNLEKMKTELKAKGFYAPFLVWENRSGKHVMDGHQRVKALTELREEGWEIPPLPVAIVKARTVKEAKAKLLHITSQYGEFNTGALYDYVTEFEIALDTIRLTQDELTVQEMGFNIDGFFTEIERAPNGAGGNGQDEGPQVIQCPHCGKEFEY